MEITEHRTVTVSAPRATAQSGARTSQIHAHIWLRFQPEGGDVLERHVHLVRPMSGGDWHEVDLSRLPLTPLVSTSESPGPEPVLPADAKGSLEAFLASWHPTVHRVAQTGHLSGLDEPLASFRTRMLAVLRPKVQETIRSLAATDDPSAAGSKADMARQMHELTSGIEPVATPSAAELAHRVELGVLVIPSGVELPPVRDRDLMVDGPPRQG